MFYVTTYIIGYIIYIWFDDFFIDLKHYPVFQTALVFLILEFTDISLFNRMLLGVLIGIILSDFIFQYLMHIEKKRKLQAVIRFIYDEDESDKTD